MKAVRLHDIGDLRLDSIDAPAGPGPGEVLLAVEAAGICGSDLHNFRTGQWISRRPSTAGHELSGRILAVGQGVETLSVGDRVAADSRVWCGACPACTSGRTNICEHLGFVGEVCDGGFAEQIVLPARLVVRHDPPCRPASPPWPSRSPSACMPCVAWRRRPASPCWLPAAARSEVSPPCCWRACTTDPSCSPI